MMEHHRLVLTNIGFVVVLCCLLLYVLQSLLRGAKKTMFRAAPPATLVGAQMVSLFSLMPEPTAQHPAALRICGRDFDVTVRDLGVEGAFVLFPSPPPLGETVALRLRFTDHPELRPDGEVIWSNAGVPAHQVVSRGMRVRFRWAAPEEAARLRRILAETVERSDGETVGRWDGAGRMADVSDRMSEVGKVSEEERRLRDWVSACGRG